MQTTHTIQYKDSRTLDELKDESIHLVVTSPPYPMIAMWDEVFIRMNPEIGDCLENQDGATAFELMHNELAKVWTQVYRILVPGGFACINIGDATRTIAGEFRLYSNHSKILTTFVSLGFDVFPDIVWRKPTNSPTKFMGSGMLPCGAYVTLEHEMILILHRPGKRCFSTQDQKKNRHHSSYFWEERNKWFSDIWELNGMRQSLNANQIRIRSGAYPLEIPLRLINMYSSKYDFVFDPFLGTATTTFAAIASCRNSLGYEIEPGFRELHRTDLLSSDVRNMANSITDNRLRSHTQFIADYRSRGREPAYRHKTGFPVITKQEITMSFERVKKIYLANDDTYHVDYEPWAFDQELFNLSDRKVTS